jgi:hypothetical protein
MISNVTIDPENNAIILFGRENLVTDGDTEVPSVSENVTVSSRMRIQNATKRVLPRLIHAD